MEVIWIGTPKSYNNTNRLTGFSSVGPATLSVFVYGVSTHLFSSLSASSKPDMSDSATVLEAFKFIESAAAEFSDEDEEEDSEGRDKTILDLAAVRL